MRRAAPWAVGLLAFLEGVWPGGAVWGSDPEERYRIVCRGPFEHEFSAGVRQPPSGGAGEQRLGTLDWDEIIFSFRPGTRAAAPSGRALAPGTCSWMDRTVDPREPTRIAVVLSRRSPNDDLAAIGLINCLPDPNCVFSLRTTNKAGRLDARAFMMIRHLPSGMQ
jgi:hypothetical protein